MNYLTDKDMIDKICELRKQRNAIILTHNYQLGEVQDIADFVGDSLELSIKAGETDADLIVFCGVTFMAETAKLISPKKTVLLPRLESGCPMAEMADVKDLKELKQQYPNALVVCYVNSTAAIKTESDICVTSANAVNIVKNLPKDKDIIFVPDKNLGAYVQQQANRKMILWQGYCPTHMRITPQHIKQRKKEYPDSLVIVHPECSMDVIAMADEVLSTGGMCKFVNNTNNKKIVVATEMGMIYRLQNENPNNQYIPVSEQAICPNMKLTRLPDVLNALENNCNEIKFSDAEIASAKVPIIKMLEN